jgi:hypothetical protein
MWMPVALAEKPEEASILTKSMYHVKPQRPNEIQRPNGKDFLTFSPLALL